MNQPMQGWTPPPPPPSYQGPGQPAASAIRPGRVFIGVGIALAGHLLTLAVAWILAVLFSSATSNDEVAVGGDRAVFFLVAASIAQVLLMIVALAVGITMAVRKDGGIGIGIVIGWAVGLIVSPVVGFGVCVAILGGAL